MTYHNSGISSIKNYAEALKRYETTKHIRGRAEDQRPLGKRSKTDNFRISKKENGDIQCFLFRTPVVTFTPEDNIVIFLDQWVSSSTCKFIGEVIYGGFLPLCSTVLSALSLVMADNTAYKVIPLLR